jgi:hypothetical protein
MNRKSSAAPGSSLLRRGWGLGSIGLVAVSVSCTADSHGGEREARIGRVAQGVTVSPPPWIPSNCTGDADTNTLNFNIWISSSVANGDTISLATNGCYLSNGTILFEHRNNITIEGNDAIIKATSDVAVAANPNRAQLWFKASSNIVVRNLTVQGHNFEDPCGAGCSQNPFDRNIWATATDGLLIEAVHFKNAWGDALGLDYGYGEVPPTDAPTRNVTVRNSWVDTAGRHAFGCSNCENVLIADNPLITNIGLWGVNIEPEGPNWKGGNIRVERNTFSKLWLGLFSSFTKQPSVRGPLIVRDNVQTDSRFQCEEPIRIGGLQPDVAPVGIVTITGNDIRSYSNGIVVGVGEHTGETGAPVERVDIRANTVRSALPGAGCGRGHSVILFPSVASGIVSGNTLVSGDTPATAWGLVAGDDTSSPPPPPSWISICGNRGPDATATNYNQLIPCRIREGVDLNTPGSYGSNDVCGRGVAGIQCATSSGAGAFGAASVWSSAYSDAAGWNAGPEYYSTIAFPDLDGNGKADVCGRHSSGMKCALGNGAGFGTAAIWSQPGEYSDAQGWNFLDSYHGTMRFPDINGDGKADVCARAGGGIECSLSTGTAFTAEATMSTFFSNANSWVTGYYWKTIAFPDVNGDGRADICGRHREGIYCALSRATDSISTSQFKPAELWLSDFRDADGWAYGEYYYGTIRFPDLNGDGKADICGRESLGIHCAMSTGSAFGSTSLWSNSFTNAEGWLAPECYSTISYPDLNADGRADICGRCADGLRCALNTGSTFGTSSIWRADFANVDWNLPESYRTIRFPDLNDDGKADVCGRWHDGIYCALSSGTGFGTLLDWHTGTFSDANGWNAVQYYSTIRYP